MYFTKHPQSTIAAPDTNLQLTCEAVGRLPITYRWLRNGEDLIIRGNVEVEGGTISFKPFQFDHRVYKHHVGQYQCIATNQDGAVFSEPADVESYSE